jgi:hypothetical protein
MGMGFPVSYDTAQNMGGSPTHVLQFSDSQRRPPLSTLEKGGHTDGRAPPSKSPARASGWRLCAEVGRPPSLCPALPMGWCALRPPSLTSIEKQIALLNWLAN